MRLLMVQALVAVSLGLSWFYFAIWATVKLAGQTAPGGRPDTKYWLDANLGSVIRICKLVSNWYYARGEPRDPLSTKYWLDQYLGSVIRIYTNTLEGQGAPHTKYWSQEDLGSVLSQGMVR